MKTLTSIILAGALAATSIATTASGASAGGWGGPGRWQQQGGWHQNGGGWHQNAPQPQPQQYQNNNGGDAGAIFAGAIIGLAFGMIATEALSQHNAPPPSPRYGRYNVAMDPHVAWCKQTYETYDEISDTWVDFRKRVHPCIEQ